MSILAACGHPDSQAADGGPRRDGDGEDASAESIRVVAYSHDRPGTRIADAKIIFDHPDGTRQIVYTDTDGVAKVVAPAGTTVTAIQTSLSEPQTLFSSFQMLQPGDTVVVGPQQALPTVVGSFRLELPEYPGGYFYTVEASCPFHAALVDFEVRTVARFSPKVPCSTLTSATLVGRVRDVNNRLLAVSVLDDVDLMAALGGTLVMPAFGLAPQEATASLTNLPDALVSWSLGYAHGADEITLEHQTIETYAKGAIALGLSIFPVGDASMFNFTLMWPGLAGTHSTYHRYVPARITHAEFDASDMITSIIAFTPQTTAEEIKWENVSMGRAPSIVVALVESTNVRGVIYAPYDGPSLSLRSLPAGLLAPTQAPRLRRLRYYDVEGSTYREAIGSFQEMRFLDILGATLPFQLTYWTSSFPAAIPSPG